MDLSAVHLTVRYWFDEDEPHREQAACVVSDCEFETSGGLHFVVETGEPSFLALCAAHREVARNALGLA